MAATAFDVLAEPNRRRILDSLRDGERPVGELVHELRMSQPAVSKHLRALRDAGLVEVRPGRAAAVLPAPGWSRCGSSTPGSRPTGASGTERLDALEAHLDTMED